MKYVGSLLVQQCLAVITPLVLVGVLEAVVTNLLGSRKGTFLTGSGALLPLFLVSAVLGYLTGRFRPGAVRTGQWVWVLPVVIFAATLIATLAQFPFHQALEEFFAITPPGGLTTFFITYPAWCCCCYAAAMKFSSTKTA